MDRLLTYSETLERAYRKECYESDLMYMRIVLVLCVFFYSVFGILDHLVVEYHKQIFLVIRFAIVNPIFILAFALSFHRRFIHFHQMIMTVAYLAAGYGIVVMLVLVPDNFSYYGGMFLIFAVGHFMTKIYWNYASIASVSMVLLFVIAVIATAGDILWTLTYAFFYVAFLVICIYASYIAERYRRDNFLKAYNLRDDKVILERDLYNKLKDIEVANRVTIYSLARLSESRDEFTGDHIERVGTLSLRIAQHLPFEIYERNNLDKATFIKTIELASTLHDIGKVAIPEKILMKPGPLTEEEWVTMRTHTTRGHDMLKMIRDRYEKNDFINMGIDITKYHHERWDGKGYPMGISGEEIPLSARIVAVVDVYDALMSKRPYKDAFPKSISLKQIKSGSGTMFDPEIVKTFLTLFEMNETKKELG